MANNAETLKKCHEAFSAGRFDEAQTLVAPTTTVVDHGRAQTMSSREEFRGWMKAFFDSSSDIHLVDAQYIDAGDKVIAQFRAVGTQDGPLANFPATGKPFSLNVCEVWRFNENGEAVEGHNYSDGLGLLMQLGHIPPPDAEAT